MKRAKQRLPSSLARLISSIHWANSAIPRSLGAVSASEKRILRKPKYSLAELILQIPEGVLPIDPNDSEWDNMQPVGREIL